MNFQNSAKLCREREAHHRLAAKEASLLNVRNIALSAAAAWARQAEEAEEIETGLRVDLSAADAAIALEFRREGEASEDEE
jgi:hypothetical protein